MTNTQFVILMIVVVFGATLIAMLATFYFDWKRKQELAKKLNGYPCALQMYLTQDQLNLLEDICLQTGTDDVRNVVCQAFDHYQYLIERKKNGERIYTAKGPGFPLTEMHSAQLDRIKKSETN